MRPLRLAALLLPLLVAGSCKTGIGWQNDSFAAGVGLLLSDYVILDLDTGGIEARSTVPDLLTNPDYLYGRMVFRRLTGLPAALGSPALQRWAQADEQSYLGSPGSCFLAVFEATRHQWQKIAGADPASEVAPSALIGPGPTTPACGLSLEAVRSALAARFGGHLAVPTAEQWEAAARAGSTTSFAWGEARDRATIARYAVVRQTASAGGPVPPGGREANAYGYHDMAGNVWEWTADGGLRGGSWSDGLPMARPANVIRLDPDTPHALAGIRLVYVP